MNRALVEEIAAAVLYEGYILYPYRPSALKNQQRFNFGVVAPRGERGRDEGGWFMRTQCLVRAAGESELDVSVRFLQLTSRMIVPTTGPGGARGWQEAIERAVPVRVRLKDVAAAPVSRAFGWPAERSVGAVQDDAPGSGTTVRVSERIEGEVVLSASEQAEGLFTVAVQISNTTTVTGLETPLRDELLQHALLSTHAILHVEDGEFVSLTDPPPELQVLASACRQVGAWPVLVGEDSDRDAVLASPIILYDHPKIAPESAGDFFDGTEIDEMLVLRILTMTDDEKREMRESDPRARRMLERTENLSDDHMLKLHGVLRSLQPTTGGGAR